MDFYSLVKKIVNGFIPKKDTLQNNVQEPLNINEHGSPYIAVLLNKKLFPNKITTLTLTEEIVRNNVKMILLEGSSLEKEFLNTLDFPVYSPEQENNMQIHTDDSIQCIKKKILYLLNLSLKENIIYTSSNKHAIHKISYEELYLFISVLEQIDPIQLYQTYLEETNDTRQIKNTTSWSGDKLKQLLHNLSIDISQTIHSSILEKDEITLEEFILFFPNGDLPCSHLIPLGQRSKENDVTGNYLFPTNPYTIIAPSFSKQSMIHLENELLLNYGNAEENIIFVCLAEDVFDQISASNIISTTGEFYGNTGVVSLFPKKDGTRVVNVTFV